MTTTEILKQRLGNQWLTGSAAKSPAQVVGQLLAVQAQDYLGALWAIGQRLPGSDESSVEQALNNGSVIRTWPMRGTLHFVAACDAHWLVGFLAKRVLPKTKSIYKNAGIDDAALRKSTKVVTKALEKESMLTRDEVYERLERAGISTGNTRGLHITGYLAIQGLTCFGPRKGKQHTFVLMDEWLRVAPRHTPDDPASTLALRYFTGHGPATLHDFAWWSGLTITEAKRAIDATGGTLSSTKVGDNVYYTVEAETVSSGSGKKATKNSSAHLLPAFDEYTVAYKDRTLALSRGQSHRNSMEVLSPVMSINGILAGTWNRTLSKNSVQIQFKPFAPLSSSQLSKISSSARKYARFVGSNKAIIAGA